MNEIQTNRPVAQPAQNKLTPEMREKLLKQRRNKKLVRLAIIVAAILLIASAALLLKDRVLTAGVKKNQYQLVSLVNGQAYIGKLQNSPNSSYLKLTDVYTVQLAQQTEGQSTQQQQQQQPQLIKLSDQLAGSENEIYLSGNQVAFWENLRDDGKVVQAIKGGGAN